MIYFSLYSKSKDLARTIDKRKKYRVDEAIKLIKELDAYYSKYEIKETLHITIYEDKEQILFDKIELGYGDGASYLIYLQNKLEKLYEDDDSKDKFNLIKPLIDRIEEQYIKDLNNPLQEINEPNQFSDKAKQFINENKQNTFKIMILFIFLMIGIYVLWKGISSYKHHQNNDILATNVSEVIDIESEQEETIEQTPEEQNPPLDELLEQKKFAEALTYYPEEYPYIERYIFYLGIEENASLAIPHLEDFLLHQPYKKGEFDLAYLKKDYSKVIELAQEADSDERLVQLGVAYAMTGNISEAESINQELNIPSLTQVILTAKEDKIISTIKSGDIEGARQQQEVVQSEYIQKFFESFDSVNNKLNEIKQTIEAENLTDIETDELNKQKDVLEKELEALINQLS